MKKLLGLVFNRWTLLALLVGALLLAVWIIGPLVAIADLRPLDSSNARWWFSGGLLLLIALLVGWRAWRARRGNARVVDQLMAAPQAAAATPAESADLAAVRERFETALKTLRHARFNADGAKPGSGPSLWTRMSKSLGGRFLYELPWYTIIGAPGSGKTTALRNAGLHFPLADQMGDQAVRGVGGTRNCDWWFTDQAVLIDTAGRLVTQDSDQAGDKATWGGFLQLLKKARPRQPLNGVLVTVSVSDLVDKSPGDRARYAQAVRARVQELHEELGVRFPIYLLVTKCDLLAGFSETFATLDKDRRATPWGYTVPLDGPTAQESLVAEFDALLHRLNDGLIDRMQAESDPQRRQRIYGFPNQFVQLRELLQEFVGQVFSPSPFEARPMLRGVYFISGTQEGSPIDRVLGAVARRYRLEQAILPPQQSSGRSFFLQRLLTEVVFAERGIAGTNRRWERRRGALAVAGYAGLAVVVLAAAGLWAWSWSNNKAYIETVASRVESVRLGVQETPNRPTADLRPLLDALDATRGLAQAGSDNARAMGSVPWRMGFGLYQGRKLDTAARVAYEHMLVDAVLPRLAMRLEEQLRAGDQPESQYEALKAYLMMYDTRRFDAAALKKQVENDWDVRLGRELGIEQRVALSRHLDALLALDTRASPLPQDKALVDVTRTRLAAVPLPQRVYNRLRREGLSAEFPEFTISRAAGPNAANVFMRQSGLPLSSRGVPGLFSYAGYHQGFQDVVGKVTKQLADEQPWVLGVSASESRSPAALLGGDPQIDNVRRLYLTEYRDTWKTFIADIRLVPITNISQAVEKSRLLSAPDNPLLPLMRKMSSETTLSAGQGLLGAGQTQVQKAVQSLKEKTLGSLGARPAAGDSGQESLEKTIVDDEFEALRRMVTATDGGKAPIETQLGRLAELNVHLTAVAAAVQGGGAPPPSPLTTQIVADAANAPEPLRTILATLGTTSSKAALLQLRDTLSRAVRAQVFEFCNQAISGRYPFDRSSAREVRPADFAALFGPGGRFDQMEQQLAPYIDQSTKPWSFRPQNGTPLGQDVGTLPQFQKAKVIRDTFFAGGATTPTTRLEIVPVEMDATLKEFTLDIDGQLVRYAFGPLIPTAVQWPGPKGTNIVRVMVKPDTLNGMSQDGPWALYKLFDRVSFIPGKDREKYRAQFDIDGRKMTFDITTSSVNNPFRLQELQTFSCPNGL